MNSAYKYVEYRKKLVIHKPTLVEVDKIPGHGFRSMYQVNEEGKKWIENNGLSGFGESGNTVWSNTLFIDFDNSTEEAKKLFEKLKEEGIGFKVYYSGCKGYHFHINRKIEPSEHVPLSDKTFVKSLSKGADLNIYRHLQPFRIEGTIHEKTNKPKELKYEYKGSHYNVEIVAPEYKINNLELPEDSIFLDDEVMSLSMGFGSGKRNSTLCKLGQLLKRRGEPIEFIEQWIYHVNLMNNPPLEENKILKIINWLRRS